MLPFGLYESHYSDIKTAIANGQKITAIKILRDCTAIDLKDAKGIIDMLIDFKGNDPIYLFREEDIFVDDVTGIYEVDGDKASTNQLTQLYGHLYDRLSCEDKRKVDAKIYENFVRYSGQAVYDAINEVLQIPNYLGYTDVKQGAVI